MKFAAAVLMAILGLTVAAPALNAQYFGQNKVRHHERHFHVLKTKHFDIYYYTQEKEAADQAARMAERWYERLSGVFQTNLKGRQPVILYGSFPAFSETTVTPEIIGVGTGGFTEPLRRRVVLYLPGSLAASDHVLGHELVHAFQFSIMAHEGTGRTSNASLPLWFIEGMAEYLSIGPSDPDTTMWMRDAVKEDNVPSLKKLDNPKYFPYRWGEAFWAYVGGRYGDAKIGPMMSTAAHGGVAGAIQSVLHVSEKELSKDWTAALRASAEPVLSATTAVDEDGNALIREKNPGTINVSPSLSPDGRYVMFFSEKSLFSIDLFLANAQTGKIIRKITNTAFSPHFNNLEFIRSTGSWSADSRRFAFGHVKGGTAEISIYDVEKAKVVRNLPIKQVEEALTPTWSPDGGRIVFSGIKGGLTNLYEVDASTGKVTELTRDAYAELEPSWSPDGKTIAYVTDRFSTDMGDLAAGQLELALFDVGSGKSEALNTFAGSQSIDPHWSADGSSLFFISNRDGVSDVYRISRADHAIYQITNAQTGVSGITATSPALSVATRADRIVFSVFKDRGYEIVRLDGAGKLQGNRPTNKLENLSAGILPPRSKTGGEVAAYLNAPKKGLVSLEGASVQPYSAHLSLDYIAPPSLGVGVSSFGTLVGGGTAFHFSDMLGYHDLTLVAQTQFTGNGSDILRNISAQGVYLNQRSRWNWGFMAGQIPFATGAFTQSTATVQGQPALVQQAILFWQIERQAGGILQYPINRAQRVEFDGGYNNISFAADAATQAFSLTTGRLLFSGTGEVPTPSALNFGFAEAAFVGDTSVFGGVSPIGGRRYRFQAGFTGGSIDYETLLADFRQYFHILRSLSFAVRGLSFGRYGPGAEDARLQDFFLGYPSLVRGYSVNSFSVSECGAEFQQTGSCPAFDRLIGSRMVVGNAELRLELLGPLGLIPNTRGIPPIQAAPFFDAGEAWTEAQSAGFLGGPRKAVSSEGVALRFNVFGAFVGEISAAYPNDRPHQRWVWEFSFLPGF